MGNVIEKGDFSTGFDNIAEVIDMYSQTPVAVRSDGCHEPSAVATGITNFQTKIVSKSCKIDIFNKTLTIGNATVQMDGGGAEGDVYVDVHGNITTS